jgi:hypothetical protein
MQKPLVLKENPPRKKRCYKQEQTKSAITDPMHRWAGANKDVIIDRVCECEEVTETAKGQQ